MAEDTETQKESTTAEKQGQGGNRMRMLVDLLFNLVIVACVGYVGYMVYEQNKAVNVLFEQQNTFSSEQNNAAQQINQLQETVSALESQLVTAREESAALLQEQSAQLDQLQNELVSTRLRINDNNPGASQVWLLAEASSLLRLAEQHLVVSNNIRTAQALFITADDVLEQIDDPSIFSIREILAGELAALRFLPEVDIREIYLRLGAAAEQAASLQVSNDLQTEIQAGETLSLFGQPDAEPGWLSRFTSSVGDTLDNYLVVRRRDAPLQALMTPGQEAAVMQTIQLQIEQARTALIGGEQEIFTDSLNQARENVEAYLSGDPSVKSAVMMTLYSLSQQRIRSEPPPLNRTRAALQQILSVSSQDGDG